jgi:site-specific recombinase XerD
MDFEPFLRHFETNRNCSPQTIRAYRSDLKMFGAFLQDRSVSRLSQVDHSIIKEYIEHMHQKVNLRFAKIGLADSSIARRLAAISSYFEFVRATSEPKLRNPLSELLISGITNIRDRTLMTLFLATGLRVSEMQQLNRDSITIELEVDARGQDHICGSGEVVGKGNKRRRFFVDEETLYLYSEYLATRIDDNPALFLSERRQRISVRAIQHTLTIWCQRLGSPHINVHRLRHSYATKLANANISSIVLKDLMGHSSFTTTQRYFKLNDTTLARGYFSAMEYLKR